MTTFKINTVINRSVDIVNKALLNLDNFPFWQTYLKKFEIIKGEPGKIGSIGRLHYSQKGRSYILEDKLIHCEPGKKYVSEITGEVLTARVETVLISLDSKTEASIFQSLPSLIQDKTLFVVTSRLPAVVDSDRVLLLNENRLVAIGTHQSLLETNDYYRSLVSTQQTIRSHME